MGGLIETDKMLLHVESCAHCLAASSIFDRCDDWKAMAENVVDWQCSAGPFDDGQDMCAVCDGPADDTGYCGACNSGDDAEGSGKK